MNLFTPHRERIELAAKALAACKGDVEYHRLLTLYYRGERDATDPSTNVTAAYRYAYLFERHDEQLAEHNKYVSKARDLQAKLDALCKSAR